MTQEWWRIVPGWHFEAKWIWLTKLSQMCILEFNFSWVCPSHQIGQSLFWSRNLYKEVLALENARYKCLYVRKSSVQNGYMKKKCWFSYTEEKKIRTRESSRNLDLMERISMKWMHIDGILLTYSIIFIFCSSDKGLRVAYLLLPILFSQVPGQID